MNSSNFRPKNGPSIFITASDKTTALAFYMGGAYVSFHFSPEDARTLAERIINVLDNEVLDQTKKEQDHAKG